VEQLTQRVTKKIKSVQAAESEQTCSLLSGKNDCTACAMPLSETERKKITIQQDGDSTTIARVTCPTAPKFWRWRDLPFPHIEPRTIEIPADDHEHPWTNGNGSWRPRCSAGIRPAGGLVLPAPFKAAGFVAAYLAGDLSGGGSLGAIAKTRVGCPFSDARGGRRGSLHWRVGGRRDAAVPVFILGRAGTLRARSHAKGNPLAVPRRPKTATALDAAGTETEIAVEKIRAGARLLIKPGAQFPVDVEITKGNTAADESNLTGEAAPSKNLSATMRSPAPLIFGRRRGGCDQAAAESSLQKIIKLIKEAQQQKAPAQQFADKFSTLYTYGVLGLSLAMFFVWWLVPAFVSYHDLRLSFYRTMTLLVVSSPCALVLSIPSAVLAAIAWGARHGILFRGGAAVENWPRSTLSVSTRPARSPPANCALKKLKAFRPVAKAKSVSSPTRWKSCPPIRSPAPSRVTASNWDFGPSSSRIRIHHRPRLARKT